MEMSIVYCRPMHPENMIYNMRKFKAKALRLWTGCQNMDRLQSYISTHEVTSAQNYIPNPWKDFKYSGRMPLKDPMRPYE